MLQNTRFIKLAAKAYFRKAVFFYRHAMASMLRKVASSSWLEVESLWWYFESLIETYVYVWLQDYLTDISASGGNSIRVWLFVQGDFIPLWDEGTGFVLGTDGAGTLIDEVDR